MSLPHNFQFSQSSLQDYVDCPRRFQLRYLQRRVWPALDSEPALESEQFMQRGAQFHHLAHQFFLGIPADKLARQIEKDETLSRWCWILCKKPFTIKTPKSAPMPGESKF